MTYDQFLRQVQNRTGLQNKMQASTAVTATFNTLAELLSPDEREDLGAQLPDDLKHIMSVENNAEKFGLDEFYKRIGQRLETDRPQAEELAGQVITVLTDAVTRSEIDSIKEQLPEEYRILFES